MKRKFDVVAMSVKIVVNKQGDNNPNGRIYVLKENVEKLKKKIEKNSTPVDLVQPLTIRANVGDEVEIHFENKLPYHASMHIQGVDYNVQDSDGTFIGENKNSTCAPNEKIIYNWRVTEEGVYLFSDLANPLSGEKGTNSNGLFGALIVEVKGATWTDPTTGKPMNSGVYADIHHPLLPSFREFAWFFHDEMEIDDINGNIPLNPHTGEPEMTHNINYRAEPMRHRIPKHKQHESHEQQGQEKVNQEDHIKHHHSEQQSDHNDWVNGCCVGCEGEEVHHDSWAFGDPVTPILRTYVGDPMRIHVIHAGVQETHVFHHHVHQWYANYKNIESDIIDAKSISPQTTHTLQPLYGAGSYQGAFGDIIIHCHLYPHFHEGMWGIQRVFDVVQDGSQVYPDGTPILPLQQLSDRPLLAKPTLEKPGFPQFIPGVVGEKAPKPPLSVVEGREPTQLEKNHFAINARPGAVFVNPCKDETPIKEFHIVGIQLPIVYNEHGWSDPQGRIFVLAEDENDVLCGKKKPEPLVIRANAGDCISIKFTNKFPERVRANDFQLETKTYEQSLHVHFVKFDPLSCDGANVGWNYDTSAGFGETIHIQWYADVDLNASFFHDHLFANTNQVHGVFASINIQERGSRYLDPKTGQPIRSGAIATIENPLLPNFRELTLFPHDFAPLYDKEGNPLNPPPFPGSHEDPGVMGLNLRNEPLRYRVTDHDPAFSFSSKIHGDPVTPLLETYNGDPVRIRLLDGAHEESHSFNMHRQKWKKSRRNIDSRLVQKQHIGISEQFTIEFAVEGEGNFDIMYNFGSLDDIWLGLWGIIRSYQYKVPALLPLADRESPRESPTGDPKIIEKISELKTVFKNAGKKRKYEIVAMEIELPYSKYGDYDNKAIIFALSKDEKAIKEGKKIPEPLIIRGNVGDEIEITLTNKLSDKSQEPKDYGYPDVPVSRAFVPSNRISLHAQLLQYDIRNSDGSTVGFNKDQSIGPGENIKYRWYIDQDLGICNLWDMTDLRHHRHHGAFGVIITEPKGSKYLDMEKREEVDTGSQVIISHPLLGEFREFVLVMHDGVRLFDKKKELIVDPSPVIDVVDEHHVGEMETEDFEDQGSRAFNYRTERLKNRFRTLQSLHKIFSSKKYEDPSTPTFHAYPGDQTVFRLAFPSDRARSHTFILHGHKWKEDQKDLQSLTQSFVGEITVGRAENLYLYYGAGGMDKTPGDYMYRSGNIAWDLELGAWGIMRVLGSKVKKLATLSTNSNIPVNEERSPKKGTKKPIIIKLNEFGDGVVLYKGDKLVGTGTVLEITESTLVLQDKSGHLVVQSLQDNSTIIKN